MSVQCRMVIDGLGPLQPIQKTSNWPRGRGNVVCGLAEPTSVEPRCQLGFILSPILKETASTSRTEMGLPLLPDVPSASPHQSPEAGTNMLAPSGVITSTIGRGTPNIGSDVINTKRDRGPRLRREHIEIFICNVTASPPTERSNLRKEVIPCQFAE